MTLRLKEMWPQLKFTQDHFRTQFGTIKKVTINRFAI